MTSHTPSIYKVDLTCIERKLENKLNTEQWLQIFNVLNQNSTLRNKTVIILPVLQVKSILVPVIIENNANPVLLEDMCKFH